VLEEMPWVAWNGRHIQMRQRQSCSKPNQHSIDFRTSHLSSSTLIFFLRARKWCRSCAAETCHQKLGGRHSTARHRSQGAADADRREPAGADQSALRIDKVSRIWMAGATPPRLRRTRQPFLCVVLDDAQRLNV
jgi:hypothetical protein